MRMTLPLWTALLVLIDGALEAQEPKSFQQLAVIWQADVQGFQRVNSDLRDKSDDEKQAFYRSQGVDERTWVQLSRHMSEWLLTVDGFAAARDQFADQLAPVEGFDLQRYAAATAAITNGRTLDQVLAAEKIDMATWERIQGGWSARMKRDRAYVLTRLYSSYFLAGLEGKYGHIARDAARATLPGGKLTEAEPISFERYVEIQAAVTAAHGLGLEIPDVLSAEFGLTFSDWIGLSNWWGVRMRTDADRRYLMEMGRLSQEYGAVYQQKLKPAGSSNAGDGGGG